MKRWAMAAAVGLALTAAAAPAGADAGLAVTRQILIGGEERWDYVTAGDGRLYVAHGKTVTVVEIETGKVLAEIPAAGAHGVALAPASGLGFATAGKDGAVVAFDLKTLKPTTTIKAGTKPDAIVYDPASKKVICVNGTAGGLTVIDPAATGADKANQPAATVPLKGKLEFAVADGRGTAFVNIEDANALAVVDTQAMKVTGTYPVAPGEEPTGLAVDPAARKLFVGCSNAKLVVMDAAKLTVDATVPVGKGVDGVAFDPDAKVVLVPNGADGTATIVSPLAGGAYMAETMKTIAGGRTVTFDPATKAFYIPGIVEVDGKKGFGVAVVGRNK